jgi:nucleoside-diphosphate-sugar epimerase
LERPLSKKSKSKNSGPNVLVSSASDYIGFALALEILNRKWNLHVLSPVEMADPEKIKGFDVAIIHSEIPLGEENTITEATSKAGVPVVFASTTDVYDPDAVVYTPVMPVNLPNTIFATRKFVFERYLALNNPEHMIVRIPEVVGVCTVDNIPHGDSTWSHQFNRLAAGLPCPYPFPTEINIIHVCDAAKALAIAAEHVMNGEYGIWCAVTDRISVDAAIEIIRHRVTLDSWQISMDYAQPRIFPSARVPNFDPMKFNIGAFTYDIRDYRLLKSKQE